MVRAAPALRIAIDTPGVLYMHQVLVERRELQRSKMLGTVLPSPELSCVRHSASSLCAQHRLHSLARSAQTRVLALALTLTLTPALTLAHPP